MELIHTCYRIGDIDRSVEFYEALGFEERRRMPIRDEAINVFMGLPGDGDRLELTYNHGVDSYELGTGYNHIALTVDDLDGTLGELAGKGIDPEKPPYRVREGGSGTGFAAQPFALGFIAHEPRRERLDRHLPPEIAIVGEVDVTHSAASDLTFDDVTADDIARLKTRQILHHFRQTGSDVGDEKRSGLRLRTEQYVELRSNLGVVAAGVDIQPCGKLRRRDVERLLEELAHAPELSRRH